MCEIPDSSWIASPWKLKDLFHLSNRNFGADDWQVFFVHQRANVDLGTKSKQFTQPFIYNFFVPTKKSLSKVVRPLSGQVNIHFVQLTKGKLSLFYFVRLVYYYEQLPIEIQG